jgi:trans-aconitate methyltransferase
VDRVPEPELMDDPAQALAYAREDFSEPNALFVEQFMALQGPSFEGRMLDLGCGPADISLRLARAYPQARIDALDGSEAMLAFAREALDASDVAVRVRVDLICACLPWPHLPPQSYHALVSNSLLHHLHRPDVLWETLHQCARPGAAVAIMDLMRPDSVEGVERVVETYASTAPEILRRDFRNSLFAAFTPEEVRDQLCSAGLHSLRVEPVSDRHLLVSGRLRQAPRPPGTPERL